MQQTDAFKLDLFRIIEVSASTITIDEDRIRNTAKIDRTILVPSCKNVKSHDKQTPNQPFHEREEAVGAREEQLTAYKLADTPIEYAVDGIVRHIGKGN